MKTTKCSFENFQEQLPFKEICVKCLGKKVSITNFGAVGAFSWQGETKFGPESELLKASYLEFIYYFQIFLQKSQSQQELAKTVTYFTIQFHS